MSSVSFWEQHPVVCEIRAESNMHILYELRIKTIWEPETKRLQSTRGPSNGMARSACRLTQSFMIWIGLTLQLQPGQLTLLMR